MTALDHALSAIQSRAPLSLRHDVKAGARLMVEKPWRITSALFPQWLGPMPESVAGLILTASRQNSNMAAAGLAGHWTYSFSRHVAAKQALLALRVLRRRGVVSVEAVS